mmetsp:Transcript_13524/g.13724  ORF Transcript_13524/g.13724 Transcript_13524/m.13724 type:complete len:249 (+) Transcript_13524:100-846(+)
MKKDMQLVMALILCPWVTVYFVIPTLRCDLFCVRTVCVETTLLSILGHHALHHSHHVLHHFHLLLLGHVTLLVSHDLLLLLHHHLHHLHIVGVGGGIGGSIVNGWWRRQRRGWWWRWWCGRHGSGDTPSHTHDGIVVVNFVVTTIVVLVSVGRGGIHEGWGYCSATSHGGHVVQWFVIQRMRLVWRRRTSRRWLGRWHGRHGRRCVIIIIIQRDGIGYLIHQAGNDTLYISDRQVLHNVTGVVCGQCR